MRIGVFDSGIGGQSVAQAIKAAMPAHEILFRNDPEHVPYGSRSAAELRELVEPILQQMVHDGCHVIIVACNTVSTLLITELRAIIKVPLIGMEPMIKPAAALTKNKVIAVCATPGTLGSARYRVLKDRYCSTDITVLEPDCNDWSSMIEHNAVDTQIINKRINGCLDQRADVIVLGCTHYHWIEADIIKLAQNRAVVIQPEAAIIRRLQSLLHDITASERH